MMDLMDIMDGMDEQGGVGKKDEYPITNTLALLVPPSGIQYPRKDTSSFAVPDYGSTKPRAGKNHVFVVLT